MCLNFSLFVKVCRGSPAGPVSSGAYQLNLPKMKGNYFLNPRNYFLNPGNYFLIPGNYFLNPRNYFLNPRNYFLNPRNYFLIWAPNPETIYKTRIAFTNPNHWTRIAVNHLKSRDCLRQVSHVLTEREREAARLLAQAPFICFVLCSFCFVLCSLTPHLRISHCFFLTFQSVRSFNLS